MSTFFEDTMRSLLEAIEMENGNIPMTEVKGLPSKTLRACPQNSVDVQENITKTINVEQIEA